MKMIELNAVRMDLLDIAVDFDKNFRFKRVFFFIFFYNIFMKIKMTRYIIFILLSMMFFNYCKNNNKKKIEKEMDILAMQINTCFKISTIHLNKLYDEIKEIVIKNENTPILAKNIPHKRFLLFDNVVYYNKQNKNDCSIWYSGYDNNKNIMQELYFLENFDKNLQKATLNKYCYNSVFLISHKNIIMSHPYINFSIYIPQKNNFNQFLRRGFKKKGNTSWSLPYLDVMGTGYVTSFSQYIKIKNIPQYQVSIDISIPDIYQRLIKSSKTPMLVMFPPHNIITVNKSCYKLFGIMGMEKKFYTSDVKLEPIIHKYKRPVQFVNSSIKKILYDALDKTNQTKSVIMNYNKEDYVMLKKKIKIPKWIIISFMKVSK